MGHFGQQVGYWPDKIKDLLGIYIFLKKIVFMNKKMYYLIKNTWRGRSLMVSDFLVAHPSNSYYPIRHNTYWI